MSRINFLDSILGWKFYVGIGILIAVLFKVWHVIEVDKLTRNITNQVTLQITSEYNRKLIRNQEQTIQTNLDLQKAQDANTKQLQQNLKDSNTKYNLLISSLSDRPNRPGTDNQQSSAYATNNSEDRQGATASQLYREDAEAFARYSRITEELKLNLISCYESYDNAKDKLEQYSKSIQDASRSDSKVSRSDLN